MQPSRDPAFTVTVVVAGFGIVLLTLALLVLVFSAFGNILSLAQKSAVKRKNKKELKKMAAQQPLPVPPKPISVPSEPKKSSDGEISGEIIAVISAAVCEFEGKGAVIRSIKRSPAPHAERSPWAQAAVIDNTRPF